MALGSTAAAGWGVVCVRCLRNIEWLVIFERVEWSLKSTIKFHSILMRSDKWYV